MSDNTTITYARLYTLAWLEAHEAPAESVDILEQKLMESLGEYSESQEIFWTQPIPLWRAVNYLAKVRVDRQGWQQRLANFIALTNKEGDLLPGDAEAAKKAFLEFVI